VDSDISFAARGGLAFALPAVLGVELAIFGDLTLIVPDLDRLTSPLGDLLGGAEGP
jgi:hypothetical protein